ncbi:WD repeat-containing protein 17-like [Gigantopelta aegis]|uniref:WD repeat-containing protein 17-like n=1 Tax=Gigantopelta aegis TaxID=1735272 RepID=UPI001B88864C|nr:WD repeat-containing protein 17-like [Gigantopelta aegis]XP_041358788.1 WD repeat-containing protein 17-like [Gigantopelta aegis]
MTMVKQVGLLPAGCQPWNHDVCATSKDRFAYCATLAIYIYQFDRKYKEFKLQSIMSEHKKTITAISWNPQNPDLFVSSSTGHKLVVWDVVKQRPAMKLVNIKEIPVCVGWCTHDLDVVSFVYSRGPMYMWNYPKGDRGVSVVKEAQSFSSNVCQFRWHRRHLGKVVFGHMDGSISVCILGSKSKKHLLRPDNLEDSDEDDPVTSLEWDPLSTDYLLMANLHFGVRLVDTSSLSVITRFQLPSAASHIQTLAWVNGAPGMFVTGDSKSGILRIWNVSKTMPIESIKVKKTGFHALQVIDSVSSQETRSEDDTASSGCHLSSTSQVEPPTMTTQAHFALPPSQLVCTFTDGGVGLYNLGRRKWGFLRDQGHMETIFDCKFKPDNSELLATASFDGTIKVWDISTLKAMYTSPGNEGVIYNISWAPADLNCIVACTSKNGAFIWDIDRGKVTKRFTEHGRQSVYSVSWNQKDSKLIMTCGGDGYCIIQQVDGKVIHRYKHPGTVFGCDWNSHNKDMLATGCEDKCVRVFYMPASSEQPLKVFSGHSAKVFHVRWSPLREGILCSGSDDGSIRVWEYTQEQCISVLSGHSGPVRGLMWNTEIPYLLISGSWDYSIRIWDTRDGACIDTVMDHGADVYGLTCHPKRPFLLASSSRDSTVRLWSLTSLIQPIELNILARKPWTEIIGSTESAMCLGTPPLLTGKHSRQLKQQLEHMEGDVFSHTLRLFSNFFTQPAGSNNLWELVSVVRDDDSFVLSPTYKTGIVHMKHLTVYKASEAQELEMIKMSKFGGGIGAPSKDDQLREAANIHIRLGNVQRYCELMVELGEWEKALCVAPAVSINYWKSLTQRYADSFVREDRDEAIVLDIATGNAKQLVEFFRKRGQLSDAVLTAQVACEGLLPQISAASVTTSVMINGYDSNSKENIKLLQETSDELADWYFQNGLPAMAACCHLAVNDCQKAMSKLIRGNELELAVSIGTVLNTTPQHLHNAIELLSRRCEQLGKWDLAVDMLKLIPDNRLLLARLCARCAASMDEINYLHQAANFPSMDECLAEAERLRTKAHRFECCLFYILSTSPELGLSIGLEKVKGDLNLEGWTVEDVWDFLQIMSCIKTERLQQNIKMMCELLTLCAYIGGLVAIRRQYYSIVPALFEHARSLMHKQKVDIPLPDGQITSELLAWKAVHNNVSNSPPDESLLLAEGDSLYQLIMKRIGKESSPIELGPDCVASSHLPSHSDVHVSIITGERIQGLAYFLEDGKSTISVNEALMWAKVNPFSPLGSGMRINPF